MAPTISKCSYCGLENESARSFCKKCGYPVSAATIGDFTDDERASVWRSLCDLYVQMKTELSGESNLDSRVLAEYPLLEQYLSYFWLRPLAGLWDAVVGTQLSKIDFPGPSIDIGCGDGVFSSIFMGTKYDENFDIATGMKTEGKDLFDHCDVGTFSRYVKEHPPRSFDIGIDIKENLVLKAAESGAYKTTRIDDGVLLSTIPSGTIGSAWSNVIKNFDDVELALSNVYRVLKPGGFIVTQLPLPFMLDNFYYYSQYTRETDEQKKLHLWKMTRGEPAYHPRYLSTEEWSAMFVKMGFSDVQVVGYAVNRHILQMWDTGFRLFIRELAHFSRFLSRVDALPMIKKSIVEWCIQQSIPLLNYEKQARHPDHYSFVLLKAFK
ncbi:MAG: hypothetical protein K9J74_00235 [Sulfuritalea sp.]|nr:hypothetical protein [Sulfuritalea sp.]